MVLAGADAATRADPWFVRRRGLPRRRLALAAGGRWSLPRAAPVRSVAPWPTPSVADGDAPGPATPDAALCTTLAVSATRPTSRPEGERRLAAARPRPAEARGRRRARRGVARRPRPGCSTAATGRSASRTAARCWPPRPSSGYTANPHAQAIARGASNVVGLVVHDIADPYFSAIADGVMRQAAARGGHGHAPVTRRDPERELEYVATLRAQRARAVILAGSRTTDAELDRAAGQGAGGVHRVRRVGSPASARTALGAHTVRAAEPGRRPRAGARAGRARARRFAVLAGPPELLTARDRLRGLPGRAARRPASPATVRVRPRRRSPATAGTTRPNALLADGLRRDLRVRGQRRDGGGGDGGVPRRRAVGAGGRVGGRVRRHRDPARRDAAAHHRAAAAGGDGPARGAAGARPGAPATAPTVETVRGDVLLRQSTAPPRQRAAASPT